MDTSRAATDVPVSSGRDSSGRWRCYRFGGAVDVAVRNRRLPVSLAKLLEPLRISWSSGRPGLGLVLDRQKRSGATSSITCCSRGLYKGIPWETSMVTNPVTRQVQCYFHSRPLFTWLTMKMVLGPYLKQCVARQGCLPLCGSSFQLDDVQYVITGFPGFGKTRLMLQAVSQGASFCCDEEMYLSNTGDVEGFFNFVNLKLGTVYCTAYWNMLDVRTRARLHINHMVSLLTREKITFTMPVDSREMDLSRSAAAPGRLVFIHLDHGSGVRKSTGKDMLHSLSQWESDHRTWFGGLFYSEQDFTAISESISPSLEKHSFWRIPANCTLEDILELK